ncbi:precorrin-3B C(17)-methyltransferase [Ruminococcus flavefaciens]|uniref:precorrin-3B C(17)-methyltransferase n=1 Tax=Ruminococcus flavefaciens TaxID=1265 RepID=UPI0026F21C9E|nr:precorrin-3B C(17)-methyltransferase [Ruminococcus flavefaciens]MDD7516574.1 precorrin-3B C(17)-methyltransferase [Ruminococcus flavefaciens]MDY5691760.1 precorrin-3B C(17)-methyltransferase [Ruminococcus flavefaciens]
MKLYVVGIGCGSRNGLTLEAEQAILKSSLIVGYTVYTDQIKRFYPEKECLSTGMRQEKDRVKLALEKASQGETVSLVCSGDSQLYGMAGLAIEMSAEYPDVEVETVAGVTAALSGGAVLGSPMTHDMAVISLSDLLTPMEKIVKRLRCAADGDFVIAIYNPSSKKRADYLMKACDIILEYRPSDTVCGYVRNIGREGQESRVLTLGELRDTQVDMFTTVFIGNSETKITGGKMVTPRGYANV